jgi:hypothetical protein
MANSVVDFKHMEGRVYVALDETRPGLWEDWGYPIDALLRYVAMTIGDEFYVAKKIAAACKLDRSTLYRCRHDKQVFTDRLLLNIHDYSGLPVAEIRDWMDLKPNIRRYDDDPSTQYQRTFGPRPSKRTGRILPGTENGNPAGE